ncbi:MAG TPA: ABC transporter ATP-binding protein [Mycobacteriales bacterium]|nr:ABC transporter ATP-binding protein [Mycobacteriales bacterium]
MADAAPAGRFQAAREMVAIAWQADRRRVVAVTVIFALDAFAGSLLALWLGRLTDAVRGRDTTTITVMAVLLALSTVGTVGLDYAGSRVQQVLTERAKHVIDRRLLAMVGGAPTLVIQETPEHLAQLELLQEDSWIFGSVIPSLVNAFNTAVRVVITVVLLASVDPLLLLLPVFGIPLILAGPQVNDLFIRGGELSAESIRRATSLFELTLTAGPAKEIRLFRLESELQRRFHEAQTEMREIQQRLQLRGALLSLLVRTIFLVGYLAAIVLVTWRAVHGDLTVGTVVLTAVLCGQVLGLMSTSATLTQWTLRTITAAARFVYLQDVTAPEPGAGEQEPPSRLRDGITVHNVSFRYPGRRADTIRNLDLSLPAGSTVAIVGDNGAGKSTFVKLLAGLYRPTNGRITVDGIDLADVSATEWRQHVSAAFQDHARFEFLLQETVGIGRLSDLDDPTAVKAALERAGAADIPDRLPGGMQTQLGIAWDGGIDLSGGQWQKLAIGRAMMRTDPLLLLLDEPTAALDAESEYQLFERWTRMAEQVKSATGAITLLISHRFSTVRMADLIVVLGDGAVAEMGTHDELMAAGGTYAELFELQARAYR